MSSAINVKLGTVQSNKRGNYRRIILYLSGGENIDEK